MAASRTACLIVLLLYALINNARLICSSAVAYRKSGHELQGLLSFVLSRHDIFTNAMFLPCVYMSVCQRITEKGEDKLLLIFFCIGVHGCVASNAARL